MQPPLGVVDDVRVAGGRCTSCPSSWSLLLYTDGLIEGRTGVGTRPARRRRAARRWSAGELDASGETGLVAALVERAEELNGGPMLDDVAAFLVQRR